MSAWTWTLKQGYKLKCIRTLSCSLYYKRFEFHVLQLQMKMQELVIQHKQLSILRQVWLLLQVYRFCSYRRIPEKLCRTKQTLLDDSLQSRKEEVKCDIVCLVYVGWILRGQFLNQHCWGENRIGISCYSYALDHLVKACFPFITDPRVHHCSSDRTPARSANHDPEARRPSGLPCDSNQVPVSCSLWIPSYRASGLQTYWEG